MSADPEKDTAGSVPEQHAHEEIDHSSDSEDPEKGVDTDPTKDAVPNQQAHPQSDGGPVKKSQSKASANDVNSVPNGGPVAWLQVLGAWSLFFNTWGILNTFGVYQTYYESIHLASSSDISWIGSIQSFLLLFIGVVTGPIYDAGYLKALLFTGTFGVVFGHMMLSLVHTYWQAVLAQALVIGLGAGCLFIPSVAIISTYFTTKISTAIGIAASGSSLGGVIYPIMFYKLVPEVGFGWAVRILGFTALALLAIPCAVMKMRVKPPAKRKLFSFEPFKEVPYTLFCFGAITGFMGLYVVFFYISYYGLASGLTNPSLSFYLIPILNATSTFGRIIPNIVADKVGPNNLMFPSAVISSIITYAAISTNSAAGVVLVAAFYGFCSGTFVSLPPSIIVRLTPVNKRFMIGTRLGMVFTFGSIGALVGGPVAGAILTSENHFDKMFIFGGSMLMAGAVFFGLTRMTAANWKLVAKI